MTEGYFFIITEIDEKRHYVGELKGDPYFTPEKAHAKRFMTYDSAIKYKNSHRQIAQGRVVEIF